MFCWQYILACHYAHIQLSKNQNVLLAIYFATCRGRAPCRATRTVITAENNRMRFNVSVLMLKSVEHYLLAGTGQGPVLAYQTEYRLVEIFE